MKLSLYTDGGSRGNPGPAAAGIVILDDGNKQVCLKSKYLGKTTNNQAEYEGLLLGLSEVIKLAKIPAVVELEVFMDSELVIKQMRGEYRVKDEGLKPLYDKVCNLAERIGSVKYIHVRREKNAIADRLVNEALDKEAS